MPFIASRRPEANTSEGRVRTAAKLLLPLIQSKGIGPTHPHTQADGIISYLAHAHGLDSVQILFPYPEVIATSAACMTRSATAIRSCLPLELRTGWRAAEACACHEDERQAPFWSLRCDSAPRQT